MSVLDRASSIKLLLVHPNTRGESQSGNSHLLDWVQTKLNCIRILLSKGCANLSSAGDGRERSLGNAEGASLEIKSLTVSPLL